MILTKEEQDGRVNVTYNSSNILASSYDPTNKDLIVVFKAGSRYKYPNVTESDYTTFEKAESQGVVFNTHIKKYDFEKLAAIDPNNLLTEIAKVNAANKTNILDSKKAKIYVTLKEILALEKPTSTDLTPDDINTMFSDRLEILEGQINEFLSSK